MTSGPPYRPDALLYLRMSPVRLTEQQLHGQIIFANWGVLTCDKSPSIKSAIPIRNGERFPERTESLRRSASFVSF
jgi:hypothetical protein